MANIICNVTGNERKKLAQALSKILLFDLSYAGAPTFAYKVGEYTVDKEGTIVCPSFVEKEIVRQIADNLVNEGFTPEIIETTEDETVLEEHTSEAPEEALQDANDEPSEDGDETAPEDEISLPNGESASGIITVRMPRSALSDDTLLKLNAIVFNKAVLFKRSLGVDSLEINVDEDSVSFPWFPVTGTAGEAEAYGQFIAALCNMAKEQTRVLDKPYDGDNDRFAMRIFMVRLGMKGGEFALARKLMMKNLSGNSGWRYGAPPKKSDVIEDVSFSQNNSSVTESDVLEAEARIEGGEALERD